MFVRIFASRLFLIALLCVCLFLGGCGNDSSSTQTLTLTPSTFNITVDTGTGNVTGASAITATLDNSPLDLSNIIWTVQSSMVAPGCFGIDQTGVPHCNSGCGNSYSGTITGTVKNTTSGTNTVGTAATVTVNCTLQ